MAFCEISMINLCLHLEDLTSNDFKIALFDAISVSMQVVLPYSK